MTYGCVAGGIEISGGLLSIAYDTVEEAVLKSPAKISASPSPESIPQVQVGAQPSAQDVHLGGSGVQRPEKAQEGGSSHSSACPEGKGRRSKRSSLAPGFEELQFGSNFSADALHDNPLRRNL